MLRTLRTAICAALLSALASAARADALDQIHQRGTLRWGGDKSGGGPYILEDAQGNLSGFEVELADYLAGKLGVTSEFTQGQWDKLLDVLDRGDIDIVLNGYEWTPERERRCASSIPYYIYKLDLLVRQDNQTIHSWADLPGKTVGVLIGSAAERFVHKQFGAKVTSRLFDGVTNAMEQVEQKQLDATVQDEPIALYYGPRFGLRTAGEPVEPGYYVIFVRSSDSRLRERLNGAIREAIQNGTLKRIYQKYGIWTADQKRLAETAEHWPPAVAAPANTSWSDMFHYALTLGRAAWITVLLSCLAMPLAMLIGLLVAVGRLYGPWLLSRLLETYVELLRGTPLLLQLYVIYYLLPRIGIRIPAFWAGVLGLAVNYSAYEAENYRAGLLAIPRGQMEAALSLGMSTWTALRRVILPQAVRIVIPPVTNDFIALFKDTSVCSVITVIELTGRYNQLYNNNPHLVLELGAMAAILYLLMSYPLSLVARQLERHYPRVVV